MTTPTKTTDQALLAELLALETAAMDRWGAGDLDGFLEINPDDVTYFDPGQEQRVDSRAALALVYDGLRGQVHIDSYEFISPTVVASGDLAVLSFVLSLIHISEPTRLGMISYAVFCLKKKK